MSLDIVLKSQHRNNWIRYGIDCSRYDCIWDIIFTHNCMQIWKYKPGIPKSWFSDRNFFCGALKLGYILYSCHWDTI